MNQIEVQILGQGYLLGCPEGAENRLREAAERVNGAMVRIRDAGKIRARDRIAVLAALNLAFESAERPAPQPSSLSQPQPQPRPGEGPGSGPDRWPLLLRRLDDALQDDGSRVC